MVGLYSIYLLLFTTEKSILYKFYTAIKASMEWHNDTVMER